MQIRETLEAPDFLAPASPVQKEIYATAQFSSAGNPNLDCSCPQNAALFHNGDVIGGFSVDSRRAMVQTRSDGSDACLSLVKSHRRIYYCSLLDSLYSIVAEADHLRDF
jgi:hypothetical protein